MRLGQGKENSKQFLKENPDVREEVDVRVRAGLGMLDEVEEAPSEEAREPEEIQA